MDSLIAVLAQCYFVFFILQIKYWDGNVGVEKKMSG